MATSTLPVDIPTSTQITVITAKIEKYNASGTAEGYEYHYYMIPFLMWFVMAVVIIWPLSIFGQELVKRYRKLN